MIGFFRTQRRFLRRFAWQQPITQQTIGEFLRDINYFDQPKTSIDIGLKHQVQPESAKPATIDRKLKEVKDIDEIINYKESEVPPLDYEDAKLDLDRLVDLAQYYGIYRDLFGSYTPNRNDIHFTPDQAKRMARLVPFYWITDQPHARVQRHPIEIEPIKFFRPFVRIAANFVSLNATDNETIIGHTVYHGNHIQACDALKKPSITLDGRILSQGISEDKLTNDKESNNWNPGSIHTENFDDSFEGYLTVALVNLDSFVPNSGLLHWMVTNIKPGQSPNNFQEVCDYLPVHGIRGFGYSRYVFIVLNHSSKLDADQLRIDDFSTLKRTFQLPKFMETIKDANPIPVGLSWFQSTWDESSNKIFHDYLKCQAPEYEHVQTKYEDHGDKAYPGRLPFNIYLDHRRNKKDINEQVLLERLKSVNPLDYKDQYVPPKVPETVFVPADPRDNPPSWMQPVNFKKANKIGYWRGLRPASAILPLNNNADLDRPCRPLESAQRIPLDEPNQYIGLYKKKMIRDTPMDKPANEHEAIFVQDDHDIYLEEVKAIVDEMKSENQVKEKKAKKVKS